MWGDRLYSRPVEGAVAVARPGELALHQRKAFAADARQLRLRKRNVAVRLAFPAGL